MRNTLFDRNINVFLLLNNLLSFAGFALVLFLNDLALSLASRTIWLHLLIHARAQRQHLYNNTSAFALCTSFDVGSTFALASFTASIPLNWHFHNLSFVGCFQCYLERLLGWLNLLNLLAALPPHPSPKDHAHNIRRAVISATEEVHI